MKKLWEIYLENAYDLNSILIGIDLGVAVGLMLGIAFILMHNMGII